MNLGDRIRSGVKWVLAGNVGAQILHLLFAIVLARLLMPSDFGLLVTVQIFTGVAMLIAGGGMGKALVQAKTLGPQDSDVIFTAQLIIGLLLFAIFFSISPWFARWFDEPIYADLLRVSTLTFLVRPFSNVPSALLQRAMRYKAQAMINTFSAVIAGLCSISLALAGLGVWSLVLGGLLGAVLVAAMMMNSARWRPRLRLDRSVLERLGSYGLKVSMNDIVNHFYNQTANFVISRFVGPAAVGLFNKAGSLAEGPNRIIGQSANKVVFRALSEAQDNLGSSQYVFLRTITLVSVYVFPFLIGFWWVAESLVVTVYGAHWAESAPSLRILAIGGLFAVVTTQMTAVTAARKLLGRELIIRLIAWAALIAFVAVGYRFGIEGVAWAVVAATALRAILMYRLVTRELRVRLIAFVTALRPALVLNGILVATLGLGHVLALSDYQHQHPIYLLGMAAVGVGIYVAGFLYLPQQELKKEAWRWKRRLHLPTGTEPGSR